MNKNKHISVSARPFLEFFSVEFPVYIIHQMTFTILYSNACFQKYWPQALPGKICHQAIWGSEQPCTFCICQQLTSEIRQASKTIKLSQNKGATELKALALDWEGQPAILLMGIPQAFSQTQQERLAPAGSPDTFYSGALEAMHFLVLDILPEKQTFTMLVCHSLPENTPMEGSWEHFLSTFSQHMYPEDQEIFTRRFGLDALKTIAFSSSRIQMDFQLQSDRQKNLWKRATALSCQDQNTRRILFFLTDITRQKNSLSQSELLAKQLDHALRNIYDELYLIDVTNNYYKIQYHLHDKFMTPPEEGILSSTLQAVAQTMIYPEDKDRFLDFFSIENIHQDFQAGKENRMAEFRKRWKDGSFHWASLTLFPFQDAGADEKYLCFVMDVDEKKQAEALILKNHVLEQRKRDDERYRTIVQQTGTLVFEWNAACNGYYISPEIHQLFPAAYTENPVQVWLNNNVVYTEDITKAQQFLEAPKQNQPHREMTIRIRKTNGSFLWYRVTATYLFENGVLDRIIGTLNDVDEATRSIVTLKYRAEFDSLTNIYNMATFYARTQELLVAETQKYFILRLDIDRFKVINDLYGTLEGDALLRHIATLIQERVHGHGTYGRLGGDIFCMCVDFTDEVLQNFIQYVCDQLAIYPLPYKIIPSFGICQADPSTPVHLLCDWANLALKKIKGSYLKRFAYYDEKIRERILTEKKIENEMHEALQEHQFVMYLQPKVAIANRAILGAEGLVRWEHPTEGLIPPDKFIPLFERNAFIIKLDEYIWEQACICLRRWQDHGLKPLPISVNVSRMHIHDTRFQDKLLQLIKRYGLEPRLLELELTESAFLENEKKLYAAMQDLQRHGFLFSMDDFGSGYSSLNMLKSIPIDTIKIDRGFLNEIVTTEQGKTVIHYMIAMARHMNKDVIAEGVETQEQADFLLETGCPHAQGFLYSRPIPIAQFEQLAYGTTFEI